MMRTSERIEALEAAVAELQKKVAALEKQKAPQKPKTPKK